VDVEPFGETGSVGLLRLGPHVGVWGVYRKQEGGGDGAVRRDSTGRGCAVRRSMGTAVRSGGGRGKESRVDVQ
jgi:hypothetical protein